MKMLRHNKMILLQIKTNVVYAIVHFIIFILYIIIKSITINTCSYAVSCMDSWIRWYVFINIVHFSGRHGITRLISYLHISVVTASHLIPHSHLAFLP